MREPLTPWARSMVRFVIWSFLLSLAWAYRGPAGAVLVLVVGLAIQRGLRYGWWTLRPGAVRATFLACQYGALGWLAKSGGRVSEQDIASVEVLMRSMQLNDEQRADAIASFNLGRRWHQGSRHGRLQRDFQRLRRLAATRPGLQADFLRILIRTILRGHPPDSNQRHALSRIAQWIGAREALVQECLAAAAEPEGDDTIAYQELGLADDASTDEIKRAYRRLMRRYHPDKLAAQTMNDDDRRAAEDKVRRVRAAYDQLRRRRGFR